MINMNEIIREALNLGIIYYIRTLLNIVIVIGLPILGGIVFEKIIAKCVYKLSILFGDSRRDAKKKARQMENFIDLASSMNDLDGYIKKL